MNMFEFSLSRAIIRSKYTIVLTLGAVIGVTCLIVIISLFNNYFLTSENVFMGIHPHISLQKEGMTDKESRDTAYRLRQRFPQIQAAMPALYYEAKAEIAKVSKKKFFCVKEEGKLVCYDETKHKGNVQLIPRFGFTILDKRKTTVLVKGISVENNETVSGIKKIIAGSTRLDDLNLNIDLNGNHMPLSFYMQQDLFLGAVGLKDFLLQFPKSGAQQHHFLQRGTLGMGTKKGKFPLLVMSLKNARKCLNMEGIANTIELRIQDPYEAENLSREITAMLGPGFSVENWIDHSRASFAFLRIIKIMILSIIFSISIVAAIGMISTLTLIVMQNRGKIAILKSMGITDWSIYKIFILNTGLTGLIGVTMGTVLGYLSGHLFIRHFSDILHKLGIKNPRLLLEPQEVLIIGILVLVLFLLTAIVPSRRAVTAEIVDGLKEQ